ncbi:hypothetical protein FHR32_008664 [Streptosporangium album]|uniref:Uncharacterized protein n=1 Tax=Streptosporangium album TaxID=47479 RepID=A0A7W7S6Q3_9ACTN|nr:hypothetical protein [Streptosporangium album]
MKGVQVYGGFGECRCPWSAIQWISTRFLAPCSATV